MSSIKHAIEILPERAVIEIMRTCALDHRWEIVDLVKRFVARCPDPTRIESAVYAVPGTQLKLHLMR